MAHVPSAFPGYHSTQFLFAVDFHSCYRVARFHGRTGTHLFRQSFQCDISGSTKKRRSDAYQRIISTDANQYGSACEFDVYCRFLLRHSHTYVWKDRTEFHDFSYDILVCVRIIWSAFAISVWIFFRFCSRFILALWNCFSLCFFGYTFACIPKTEDSLW